MAEVSYTVCDFCKKKIEKGKRWNIEITPPPLQTEKTKVYEFDVCNDCAGYPVTVKKVKGWLARFFKYD